MCRAVILKLSCLRREKEGVRRIRSGWGGRFVLSLGASPRSRVSVSQGLAPHVTFFPERRRRVRRQTTAPRAVPGQPRNIGKAPGHRRLPGEGERRVLLGARFRTWGGDTDAATGGGGGSSQGDWRKQRVESGCTRFGVEGMPAQQIYGARACSAGPNTSGPSAARGTRRACEKAERGCCGSGSPSIPWGGGDAGPNATGRQIREAQSHPARERADGRECQSHGARASRFGVSPRHLAPLPRVSGSVLLMRGVSKCLENEPGGTSSSRVGGTSG